jgi:hypothetical protein
LRGGVGVDPGERTRAAILLSEVEMQQTSTSGFHEPLLPPPFADDGSWGRTAELRKRGRRKKRKSSG